MQSFPAVDPIPLPAPVWLFKLLHIVTLSLHFVAVQSQAITTSCSSDRTSG